MAVTARASVGTKTKSTNEVMRRTGRMVRVDPARAGSRNTGKDEDIMHLARGFVLVVGVILSVTLGAPVALNLFVDDAAAQATASCTYGIAPISTICTATDNDVSSELNSLTDNRGGPGRGVGVGGDGTGGDGGDGGNGGLALVHDIISTNATSETTQNVSDLRTGDIHNEMTIVVEDTDETVVILNAGNPGSTGIHLLNVGAASQAVNSGSNTSSADASGGDGGDGGNGSGGDGTGVGTGGDGGGDIAPPPPPILSPIPILGTP
jgi:hypothetical protein